MDTLTALIEMVLPDVNNNNDNNVNNADETVMTDDNTSVSMSMATVEINKYLKISSNFNCNSEFIRSDPLQWYRIHHFEFPNVAMLAKKYLCISATSAPSERMFSNCGSYVTKKRNQLEPDIVSDFIFLDSCYKFEETDEVHKKIKSFSNYNNYKNKNKFKKRNNSNNYDTNCFLLIKKKYFYHYYLLITIIIIIISLSFCT